MKLLKYSKIGAILLICILLTSIFTSCNDETAEKNGTETTDGVTASFMPDNSYVIIRSDTDDSAIDAAIFLRDAINKAYGLEMKIATDFVKRGEEVIPGEHEILIGTTNRNSSITALQSLRSRDYIYNVESENVIVITGGNGESTLEAAKKFATDMFGYEGAVSADALTIGDTYDFKYDYPVKNLSINSIPYNEYTFVCDGSLKDAADSVMLAYEEITGISLPVESNINVDADHAVRLKTLPSSSFSSFEYHIYSDDKDIIIESATGAVKAAASRYIELYCDGGASGDYNVNVPAEIYTGYSFEDESNGLELLKRSDTPVCDGVTYSEMEYKDKDGLPVIAYMITAAPGAVSAYCGLPFASNEMIGEKQQVIDQALAAEEAYNYDICAAVNGDLYYFETNNLPCGMNFKNGKKLSEGDGSAFFAVLKDGSYFVGNPGEVDEALIDQAIGGRYLLMQEGLITDIGYGIDFAYLRHPRTTVGFKEDGTLILIVVDGRQPSHSNGASLADMALIYKSLGAYGAVNIDGGGTSICITKNYESGEFKYWNSPSDGSPRKAVNCLLLARNEDYKG